MKTSRSKSRRNPLDTTDNQPAPLAIPPFTARATHYDREFCAVGIHLDVLGMHHVPYVAMSVAKHGEVPHKWIEIDEAAHKFLTAMGLPEAAARALVALAIALRGDDRQPRGERP